MQYTHSSVIISLDLIAWPFPVDANFLFPAAFLWIRLVSFLWKLLQMLLFKNIIALHCIQKVDIVREREGAFFLSNKNLSIMAWALITAIIRAKYVFTLMCGAALKIVKHTKHIYLHIELKARIFVFHSVRMCVSAHPHSLALSLSLFLSFSLSIFLSGFCILRLALLRLRLLTLSVCCRISSIN